MKAVYEPSKISAYLISVIHAFSTSSLHCPETATMTVTELGCMGVKPGLDIMDPSKPEGRILPDAWRTVTTKPGGPSRVCWGLEHEDPSRVWAFFDWESVEQHHNFIKT